MRLTGLGARYSLRLEAGLCLYGNDMEQHTTPVEAGLTWAIGKRRRAEGGFLGAEVILKQLADGPSIRRVGFFSSGPPPRSHSEIQDEKGANIGEVTSGGFSPCLKEEHSHGVCEIRVTQGRDQSEDCDSRKDKRWGCHKNAICTNKILQAILIQVVEPFQLWNKLIEISFTSFYEI